MDRDLVALRAKALSSRRQAVATPTEPLTTTTPPSTANATAKAKVNGSNVNKENRNEFSNGIAPNLNNIQPATDWHEVANSSESTIWWMNGFNSGLGTRRTFKDNGHEDQLE